MHDEKTDGWRSRRTNWIPNARLFWIVGLNKKTGEKCKGDPVMVGAYFLRDQALPEATKLPRPFGNDNGCVER